MKVAQEPRRLKMLVAIASFGEKNLDCLKRVIETYRRMDMDVEVVVTAEAPKSVDLGVDVVAGTPTRNPHSLPFAHKRLFADNVDRYDVFVYTEDDIDVSEENVRAFVHISEVLKPNEIAGFVRYEIGPDGTRSLPDVHGRFHWRPESVRRRGGYMIAEFTNEHAGCYILTNEQLRRALASGAFLSRPYEGRYEMLESAATDVYVNCGFRKVIGISHLDQFLVHHMPNRYVGQMGVPLPLFSEQIQTLKRIERGAHPATTLCEVEPKVLGRRWGKRYDERLSDELLRMVPADATSVLSVGCGSGAAERALQTEGLAVTAFPLDSVVGATAARLGIEVVFGSLEECFQQVSGRQFDCVIVPNLIHLVAEPSTVVNQCANLVRENGALLIEGPNFARLPVLLRRALGAPPYRNFRSFTATGMQVHGIRAVKRMLQRSGFQATTVRWRTGVLPRSLKYLARWPPRLAAHSWVVRAQRGRVQQLAQMARTAGPARSWREKVS